MTEKLKNKKMLKTKDGEKELTFEQKIKLLEEEKKRWQECWNAMLAKAGEFFPSRKIKDPFCDIPKEKDIRNVIVNCFYEMVDKVNEDFEKRKTNILNQMPPTQRWEWEWNELQKEKQAWNKICQETLKKIDEHYKTHKGGGMFYRWFDDDNYYQMEHFNKIESKLQKQNPELYAKKMLELKKQEEQKEKQIV